MLNTDDNKITEFFLEHEKNGGTFSENKIDPNYEMCLSEEFQKNP
jgi:hypothetical protein